MFFQSWEPILRILIVGVLAYSAIVFFLRVSGKRTLAKMNAFDLIVTVALGSTLSTILLDKKVPLAEGVAAFILLIYMQYLVAWASSKSKGIDQVVKSNPRILYYNRQYMNKAMEEERITEMDLFQAIRKAGHGSMEEVTAVILESNGDISVLGSSAQLSDELKQNVIGFDEKQKKEQKKR
ncbi:DUF421 domain-containing protein [Bacillus thermotolerans]|uniref:DUF421 domain-containing protein n=1 Tax=Bacillus thermotolerans TaxID=1221996 RepID=A0A0F5HXZ1_BACTR|nr:YetF domain-containing protein [Bacillus thermotolerans]KKB38254.1 hypothetical protein QY97_02787 [Bacillus thermotolerans]KKB39801.1 hypothetical protein QY95_02018 [Bacillus thermotolerans]KKB44237.1 hypothetical protein QY96_03259 [Bacillus thermotolerans]